MSTNITAAAEAAREQARDSSGRFGRQPAAEAVTPLSPVHGPGTCSGCGLPTTSGDQCRTCVTEDARDAAAAGTGPQMRLQLHGPVGEMDPQTGYLSMVAHIAEVDPGGVRERYGLDDNASHDDVITAAEVDFANIDSELVYADRWDMVSQENPYAPVSAYGPVTHPAGTHLGDISIGSESLISRTYSTGDPDAPYLTVESVHGVCAQVTGGPDDPSRYPLAHTDWQEELDARAHLKEEIERLRFARRHADDAESQKEVARLDRYVAGLKNEIIGKLSYYAASRTAWTVHSDHGDASGSGIFTQFETGESGTYHGDISAAGREADVRCSSALDDIATANFDYRDEVRR